MCGRFNVTDSPEVISMLESFGFNIKGLRPRYYQQQYNIAPTEPVMVAAQEEGEKFVREMRWWLTPAWAPEVSTKYSMFNAKSETIETSRAFKGPFTHRRCIIPASGFIEWRKEEGKKQPYYIRPVEGHCFFGGIWDIWQKHDSYLETCSIITTAASPEFADIHARMPALISPKQFDLWLDSTADLRDIRPLLKPAILTDWMYYPLNPAVNNARVKDDGAEEAIAEPRYFGKPEEE
jgi:putative SOS response-associated peptidase YedK